MFVAYLCWSTHVLPCFMDERCPFFNPIHRGEIAIRLAIRAPGREGSVGRVDLHHVSQLRKFPAMLGTAPGEHRPWRWGKRWSKKGRVPPKSSKSDHELRWWLSHPSEKWWSSSVGMMKFPIYGKIIPMFQTTNQISIETLLWIPREKTPILDELVRLSK